MVTKVMRVFMFIGQNHPSLDETRISLVNIDFSFNKPNYLLKYSLL